MRMLQPVVVATIGARKALFAQEELMPPSNYVYGCGYPGCKKRL